jgi:DNA topoisomerase-3
VGKRLIIAEKPSVARDIAQVLSVSRGQSGCFESGQWLVSSALGHLFELTFPPELAACKDKWNLKDLPLLPAKFALSPLSHSRQQLNLLLGLLKRADVTGVVNACDAGREGELIFHYIVRYAGCTKPVERLWLQSMTPASIQDSFKRLRPGSAMQSLTDAALSRAESDWLVGINASRVLTLTDLGNRLTPVGRVQTPTLAMVVSRELEIQQFVPKDYCRVKATFQAKAGAYVGTWFDPGFKGEGKPDRIWEQPKAEQIRFRCLGKTGTVTDQSKNVSRSCPALFDLTSLQREANKKFGYSAAKTLKLAQELYETYKVLTYPRTDARVLPDDYVPVAIKTMEMLAGHCPPIQGYAKRVLDNGWITPDKRIFNSAKVTDHFAIIPTGKEPGSLPPDEAALFKMVAQRFVALFYPAAEYLDTERITKIEADHFKSRGRVVLKPGWTVVYGADAQEDDDKDKDDQTLPAVGAGEHPPAVEILVVAEKTKPPLRYTEAALLSAMEGAGKIINEDELREAMSERGLGTPATRAAIIESLLGSDYLERKKKDLHATPKGIALITRLKGLTLDSLCSPQLTGEWEYKLRLMEQGKVQRSGFMHDIQGSVVMMVGKVKNAAPKTEPVAGFQCPTCKKTLVTPGGDGLMCPEKHVVFRKTVARRTLTDGEIKTLLLNGAVGPLSNFTSKKGKPFSARLRFNEKGNIAFDFGEAEKPSQVVEHEEWKIGITSTLYVGEKVKQKIYVRKSTCQRQMSLEEVKNLLSSGSTGLLDGFISKAGKTFQAALVLKQGKVEFEFQPRT